MGYGFPFTQIPYEANGNISPRRFVVPVAGTAQKAVQATAATAPPMGVSYDKTRFPPNSPSDDGYNAIAGESLSYHTWGEVANVDVGSTPITDLTVPVISDGNGRAIPLTGAEDVIYLAGMPLDLGAAGETIRVLILPPSLN